MSGFDKLREVAAEVKGGKPPPSITVRELLQWFNAQRRGVWVVREIRDALDSVELETVPDFEGAYIDGPVSFAPKNHVEKGKPAENHGLAIVEVSPVEEVVADPTYRIGRLKSANTPPLCVTPDQDIAVAITHMLHFDYSQLPVMIGERNVKGVVSWTSIGSRLALGRKCQWVRDCMDAAHIISADKSLFDAIADIVSHQYVLIRDASEKISGIVTTSDLSLQFLQLAEPFLLLGEIENHIRRIIQAGGFTIEQLNECRDPNDSARRVDGPSDLTFGEYIRLLENPKSWGLAGLAIDRRIFVEGLNNVRRIRNDVMHFDPDGVSEDDLKSLRRFTHLLQTLQHSLRVDQE